MFNIFIYSGNANVDIQGPNNEQYDPRGNISLNNMNIDPTQYNPQGIKSNSVTNKSRLNCYFNYWSLLGLIRLRYYSSFQQKWLSTLARLVDVFLRRGYKTCAEQSAVNLN